MDLYQITMPSHIRLPFILSVPHAGTYIPDDIRVQVKPDLLPPDDTDWFTDRLYDFAAALGIPLIKANYSRWVIDLNRNPGGAPLYSDGRVITSLCTATNFEGELVYSDERKEVERFVVHNRHEQYFKPYHNQLQWLLDEVKEQFGTVLLWDCHSIRRHVPAVYAEPFPDLILGSNDETSASQSIIQKTLVMLNNGSYSVSHNYPFKGGYITRHYGKPEKQQHALQLEMAKPLYMSDDEQQYNEDRAGQVRELLTDTITAVSETLLQHITR